MTVILYLLAILIPCGLAWMAYLAISEETGTRNVFRQLALLPKFLRGLTVFMLHGWVLTTVVLGIIVVSILMLRAILG